MEIRNVKAHEMVQAVQLADETFREEGHRSMGVAFPHVFSKEVSHSFGAFDGDRLVSFMGLVPSKIKIGEARLNVFSIGAVCTHKDYRKRGISTALLQEVYRYIDQAKASLLLISGDRGLYTRNHCYHFGESYQYTIEAANTESHQYEGCVRRGTAIDIFQIDRLREEKRIHFESSLWEWSTLLDASGYTSINKMKQEVYIAERQGIIEGYVVIGLSHQQESIVTEWGGQPKVVHGILLDILAKGLTTKMSIKVPTHEPYHKEFRTYPVKQLQQGGTIYVVDPKRLIDQMKPYLSEKNPALAEGINVIQREDDKLQFMYDQSDIVLTRKELIALLFDAQSELRTSELQKLFPIPFPSTEGMYYV